MFLKKIVNQAGARNETTYMQCLMTPKTAYNLLDSLNNNRRKNWVNSENLTSFIESRSLIHTEKTLRWYAFEEILCFKCKSM